jgi:hypothetical protein
LLDVIFATPCLTGGVAVEFLNSVIETDRLCLCNGIKPGWMQIGGDPYLAKVRNKMLSRFLRDFPGVRQFFFLDDDVGWPAEKVVEFLRRPEAVVAGIYPKKQETLDFPVSLAVDRDTGGLIENAGLYLAHEVPTGFLRIRREVIDTLAKGARQFKEMEHGKVNIYTEFCSMGLDATGADGWWVGEDYDLSRRIRNAGFDIWVDPDIAFTHRGSRAWKGNLADHMDILRANAMRAKEEAA